MTDSRWRAAVTFFLMLIQPIVVIISILPHAVIAGVSCTSTADCRQSLETPGVSVCEDGECTNPFEHGCLKTMIDKHGYKDDFKRFRDTLSMRRICNSDDDQNEKKKNRPCRKSTFDSIFKYDEVRIAPSKRISSVLFSWIQQILLTELMEVPSSLERRDGKKGHGSFYDRANGFDTAQADFKEKSIDALLEANNVDGDCQATDKPCAHVMPDVWANDQVYQDHIDRDELLPPTSNGMIKRFGFYVPAHTAMETPELSSLFGLKAENSTKRLAEAFLTPTTWQKYCDWKNCEKGDDVAKRAPNTDEEGKKYFVPDLFQGYFHTAAEMDIDCDERPQDEYCFGHFLNLDNSNCEWNSYAEAQLHWNGINLRSRGPDGFNNGYSYDSMLEIWQAAFETKNNVLMWWWYPDPAIERYENTTFKFHRINFPRPTETCLHYRREHIAFCSTDATERIGSNESARCDYPVERPQKYLSRSLKQQHDLSSPSKRSPAYTFLNKFEIPTYAMEEIFEDMVALEMNFDGYESREIVCKWVYDNIDSLEIYVPLSYPKIVNERRNQGLVIAAYSVATVALVLLVIISLCTYKFQERRMFRCAQVSFLVWMIAGLFLVAIGALTRADAVSNFSCVISEWSVLIGYTLELAPLLVKIQAINKVAREAIRFRRVRIDSKKLITYPVFFAVPVVIYLIVWVCLDMPVIVDNLELESLKDGQVVELNRSCSSRSLMWSTMAYVWQVLLLLSSSVLAYQSRDVMEELNESHWVGFLAYSHLLFLIFRIVIRALSALNGAILGSVAYSAESLIISLDILAGITIYFGPKFYSLLKDESTGPGSSGRNFVTASLVSATANIGRQDDVGAIARLRKFGISIVRADSSVVSRLSNARADSVVSKLSATRNGSVIIKEGEEGGEMASKVPSFPITDPEQEPTKEKHIDDTQPCCFSEDNANDIKSKVYSGEDNIPAGDIRMNSLLSAEKSSLLVKTDEEGEERNVTREDPILRDTQSEEDSPFLIDFPGNKGKDDDQINQE